MKIETATASAAKILVIDDNPIIQRTVLFALRDKGYQVLTVGEIADGMKIIRQEKLGLVLVDLSFPLLPSDVGTRQQDGFFFIDWMQRTPDITKPPIIIISSTAPGEYRARAAAAGVKFCLQKPLNKEALLAAVQSALNDVSTVEAEKQP